MPGRHETRYIHVCLVNLGASSHKGEYIAGVSEAQGNSIAQFLKFVVISCAMIDH